MIHDSSPIFLRRHLYCPEKKIAIELDGGGHTDPEQSVYDAERTASLQNKGICVLRFWNNQVLQETQGVLEAIWNELHSPDHTLPKPTLTPTLSRLRERESGAKSIHWVIL